MGVIMPERVNAGDWARGTRGLWLAALAFGAVSNLLILTGPMFMLQVYDRVLPGRSVETLLSLFVLVAFLFAMMAGIDTARSQVLARLGARARQVLEPQLFAASLQVHQRDPPDPRPLIALRDLEAVQRLSVSGLALALLDLPWTPAFILLLALAHPLLGWLAAGGAAALLCLALVGHLGQRQPQARARAEGDRAERLRAAIDEAGPDHVAGLSPQVIERWHEHRAAALTATIEASDRALRCSAQARALRMFLQAAALAAGGWLVLGDQLSPGLMVGASILLGRALGPVEQIGSQWGQLAAAVSGWRRVAAAMHNLPVAPVAQVQGSGPLSVRGLVITGADRGAPLLRLTGFDVPVGRALGVIGPGGAGKSLLARVLAGAVAPTVGVLRLGDHPVSRLPSRRIGYLPQRVTLWPGTIADAISRHDREVTAAAIEDAARLVGAHSAICALPAGYQTRIDALAAPLPAGLVRRIALARAIFGAPALVILDEPNADLDADASDAVNAAIRSLKAAGTIVVVTAHRPAAIGECDDLLVLEGGAQTGFGPRETLLRDLVRSHTDLVRARSEVGT